MKKFVTAALLALAISPAMADYTYDYKTGNSYTTIGNSVYGNNARTGSTWNSHTYGSQSFGTDSKGNSWNYDHNTGYYNNSNGKTCFGKGALRTCN